jgi:hypothetical protein
MIIRYEIKLGEILALWREEVVIMLATILVVFALVLSAIGAFYNPPKVSLGWLGFACFMLSILLRGINIH